MGLNCGPQFNFDNEEVIQDSVFGTGAADTSGVEQLERPSHREGDALPNYDPSQIGWFGQMLRPRLFRPICPGYSAGMAERSLVIKVTAGKDDPERCNQAFTVAAAAAASGVSVSLWLTGEAAWFGLPGRAEDFSLPHAAPLADLLAGVLAAGTVTVCTQCAARRDITADDLIAGIRIAGAATFVAEIMAEGAQAVVY
jgi:predicted peroxiredoxin